MPGTYSRLSGDMDRIHSVEFVDQNPIGKSTRSNPATYLKAFDEIRKLLPSNKEPSRWDFLPRISLLTPRADAARSVKEREPLLWKCSSWPILSSNASRATEKGISKMYSISSIGQEHQRCA